MDWHSLRARTSLRRAQRHPGPKCIRVLARPDGAGAQVVSLLSGAAAATRCGGVLISDEWRKVAHVEPPGDREQLRDLREFFGFRPHVPSEWPVPHVQFDVNAVCSRWRNWLRFMYWSMLHAQQAICLAGVDFRPWVLEMPEELVPLREEFRQGFQGELQVLPRLRRGRPVRAVVHVRRGDVSASENAHYFIPNAEILTRIRCFDLAMKKLDWPYELTICSNGRAEEFAELKEFGTLRLGNAPLEDLRFMAEAELLWSGKGTFSFLAALLGRRPVFHDPSQLPAMPDWFVWIPIQHPSEHAIARRVEQLVAYLKETCEPA